MRAGPDHPIIKCYPNQIDEIRKSAGFENEERLNEAIKVLDTWVKQQNHFTVQDIGYEYLESYIIAAKGSLEKAKKRLDKRLTLRNLFPEFFKNIQVKTEFTSLLKCYKHASMPIPTKDFYRITIEKFHGVKESFNLLDLGRFLHVFAEYNVVNEYVMGFEGILDLQDVSLTDILTKLNPMILQKIMIMVIEGYGAKIKALHIICASSFVDIIVSLLKQGMSEKMGKRLQIHQSPETLHKFIQKESLPSDYGGTGPSIEKANDDLFNEFYTEEHIQRMKIVDNYKTDETKRISAKFNEEYMGMPGSFRTLTVD